MGAARQQDVAASWASEERLRLAECLFDCANEGILITDPGGVILDVNAAFTEITGYAREEVLGRRPSMLASGRHEPAFYRRMWESLAETGHWTGEIWNRRRDGQLYAELLRISRVTGASGELAYYVGVFTDVTAQKRNQELLERLAHYDVLTGLPNRVLMLDRLTVTLAQAERRRGHVAVCYLDLDGFREINDRFGHAVGDELLLTAALRLRGLVRGGDTIARLGGDEFVLLLDDVRSVSEVRRVIDRVLEEVASPYMLAAMNVHVTTSVGVAVYPQHGSTAEHLLRSAAQAMFRAKRLGKNRACLVGGTDDMAIKRDARRDRLRAAIRAGELHLYYQPKVEAPSGLLRGAEALVRWVHPTDGLIPPSEFLPLVVGTSLEVELDLWIVEQALVQLARWQEQGLDPCLSVNLTAASMGEPGLAEQLAERIDRTGARASGRLELEVVESAALTDIRAAVQAVEACGELGVGFALDDFGTGYSSLAYLSQLPVQTLKIDQTFVRSMLEEPSDMHIVKAVIGLARAFGISTVAEGVETEAQATALAGLGCDLLQGFFIARAMPAADFEAWMRAR